MDMRDWEGVWGLFMGTELLRLAGVTMCPWNILVCYYSPKEQLNYLLVTMMSIGLQKI